MKRREFITAIGGAAAWPLAAHAQPAKVPRIGFLHYGSPGTSSPEVDAFRQGLRDLGYIEGKKIEYRFASGRVEATARACSRSCPSKTGCYRQPNYGGALEPPNRQPAQFPIVIAGVADAVGAGSSRAWRDPAVTPPGSRKSNTA